MSNRDIHDTVGILSGAGFAAWSAREERLEHLATEIGGGAVGGLLGSRGPDMVDPPTSPNHRSFGHGVAPCAGMIALALQELPKLQSYLREEAAKHQRAAVNTDSVALQLLRQAWAFVLHFISGAAAGAVAGYVSHLVEDAGTPSGLPVVA